MEIKEIAKRLKQARIAAGYKTAKSFIEKFGISQSSYSLHETGQRSVGSRAAITYCKLLGIDLDWLLTGKDGFPNTLGKQAASNSLLNKEVNIENRDQSLSPSTTRLSEETLQQMTLVTETKHADMVLKIIDHELLSVITREVMELFNENAERSDEIARAISGIYHNIEETTADEAGKRLLVKPLINAFKIAFEKTDDPEPELKVSNLV